MRARARSCSRCRFLRVDPAQLPRIGEMACNAEARLAEAQDRRWLGEVAALEESLKHLRQRRAEADSQLGSVRTSILEDLDAYPAAAAITPPPHPRS